MGIELTNRVAIVTGAAQGIGEATARKLAERGATVVGLDREASLLEQVMSGIPRGTAMVLDVTDAEADQRAVQEIHRRFGRIDILANVAGGSMDMPSDVEKLSIDQWHRVLALNLHAPFYLSKAVAPIMRAQRWGRIITVGSGAGRSHSRTGILPYASGKAGVHGLMRQLAVQMAPYNVTCNVVAPGLILSQRGRRMWEKRSEESKRDTLESIPLNRLGEPHEVADVIAFVASEESSYITGQLVGVDGGHWMF